MADRSEITQILRDLSAGTPDAVEKLFPVVYDELRRLAESYLQQERPDHTLQATALVHEVYLKMIDQTRVEWKNRAHFFAISAKAMRRILVDHARKKKRIKRGGNQERVLLDEALLVSGDDPNTDLVALDLALTKLEEDHPEKARVVEMRFFGGLTVEETAEVLQVVPRTVWRYWEFAKAWLYREMMPETSR